MFSLRTTTTTILLLLQTLTPTLAQRQNEALYTLLETAYDPLISSLSKALPPLSLSSLLDDANSPTAAPTADMKAAKWYSGGYLFGKDVVVEGDDDGEAWEAYGISTIADSEWKNDKYENITAVSWGNGKGGLRVTFLREDVDEKSKRRGQAVYGHALLVQPVEEDEKPSFKMVESKSEVGKGAHGLVWRGNWLLVTAGEVVRGFDLERVYKVDEEKEVGRVEGGKFGGGGYEFVIPQAKTFSIKNKDLDFQMSIASFDRNCTSACLVLGSTSSTNSFFARYEFSTPPSKSLLKSPSSSSTTTSEIPCIWASKTNIKHTRGIITAGSEAYISTTAEEKPSTSNAGGHGDLLVWKPGQYADEYNNYLFGPPGDISYDPHTNTLYTLSTIPNASSHGAPYLMALDLSYRNTTAPTINGGGPITITTSHPPSAPIIPDTPLSSSSSSSSNPPSGSNSLPQGAIAGIAVGCIATFFAISVCLYLYLHHRRYSPSRARAATAASQRKWTEKADLHSTGSKGRGKIELHGTSSAASTPTTMAGQGQGQREYAMGKAELDSTPVGNTTVVSAAGQGPFGTGFASPTSPVRGWQELSGTPARYEVGGGGDYKDKV